MSTLRKKTKAFFFSMDALIASSLIFLVILLSSNSYLSKQAGFSTQHYSNDLLRSWSELKISEVQNNSVISDLIDNGYITKLNNTIIEQIGELWAERELEAAQNLTREFSNDFIDSLYSFEVTFDDEYVHGNNNSTINNLKSAQQIISGIARNKSREGFSARANAVKLKKNTTLIVPFEIGGSAHDPGDRAYITKKFYLDIGSVDDISNASLYASISHGTSSLGSQNNVNINDGTCDFPMSDMDEIDTLSKDGTNMAFLIDDIDECLQVGWNSIELTLFVQSSGHGHLHPGTRVEIKYESQNFQNVSKIITKKVYFENIESTARGNKKTGAWAIMPLFYPEHYNMINATVFVHGKSIRNVNNEDNIQIYLNNDTLELTDPSCNLNQDCDWNNTYDLLNNLSIGTNVISIFLNTDGENFWGKGDTILYSDPENDQESSSYIEYSYEITNPTLQFGKIDVSISDPFNHTKSNNVSRMKYFNNTIYEASIELVQLDSDVVTLDANNNNQFLTPITLATPNSIFIDPEDIIQGMNTIDISDSCPDCYILNYTSLYYTLLVPSLVGYGATFNTEQQAKDDARDRLQNVLGSYVQAVEINDEVVVIGDVPYLWGPTIAKVNVWT